LDLPSNEAKYPRGEYKGGRKARTRGHLRIPQTDRTARRERRIDSNKGKWEVSVTNGTNTQEHHPPRRVDSQKKGSISPELKEIREVGETKAGIAQAYLFQTPVGNGDLQSKQSSGTVASASSSMKKRSGGTPWGLSAKELAARTAQHQRKKKTSVLDVYVKMID